MAQLQIGERLIEVDNSFLAMAPEEQQRAVDEIEQSLGGRPGQEELGWADVPGQAIQNIPASAKEFGKNLIQPIIHPIQTIESLAQLGSGAINNAFPKLAGVDKWLADKGLKAPSDPSAVAGQQQLASDVGQFFTDRYGSEEGWKNTIAKDPVGFAGDAATVLTGGGAALARVPGKLANVTSKGLLKTGNVVNPINAVTKPAGLLAGKPVAHLLGLTTGSGGDSVTEAFRAGERGGT